MTRGIRGAGRHPPGWWAELVARDGSLIPQYPGDNVVTAYVVPPPAQVDLDQTPTDVAMQLLDAYITAITASYGSAPMRRPKPRDVFTVTGALVLPKAAKLLVESRIAPLAWCMSSVDFYEAYVPRARRRRYPQLGWVYSLKRLEERVGFHTWMENTYLGGRVVLSDEHRELIARWRAMYDRLSHLAARGELPTQDEVKAVVLEELSDWGELLTRADAANKRIAAQYAKRIKNGEYVWSR